MKVLCKIMMLAFVATLFVSCSDDDDDDSGREVTTSFTHVYKIPIEGIANNPQTPVASVLNLSDMIGAENAKNYISSNIQLVNCYIQVAGVKDAPAGTKIQNLTVKVGSNSQKAVGTFAYQATGTERDTDIKLQENDDLSIIQTLMTELGSKKKANVAITFTPNTTITNSTSPVYLELAVSANVKYKVYD